MPAKASRVPIRYVYCHNPRGNSILRKARKAAIAVVFALALTSSRVRAGGPKANKLGRLDPKTGAIRKFPLKTPESGPRGLAADNAGNIWFTANYKGYIGRLDPKSGKVEEWASPGGARSQPYGIASTSDLMVWYGEAGVKPNPLVAFDPKAKSFQKWEIPSGKLYLACSGVNKVAIATVGR